MQKLRVLGVCGAQGALLYPFRHHLLANIEPRSVFHDPTELNWSLNFGKIPFQRDILPDLRDIDIILGSPSCGHSSAFSYSRKKTLGKPKQDPTMNLFVESLGYYKPKMFLMENLPKLLDLIPLIEWEEVLPDYKLIVHCHSVIDFGNSQATRKRLVMIGIRKDTGINSQYFQKIFPVAKPLKVYQIEKMVKNSQINFTEELDKKLAMYHYKDPKKKTLTVLEVKNLWLNEFRDEYKWPMKNTRMKTLPGVYRNRAKAYPLTLRPSNRQFNTSGLPMGLEEYRIIMGFPKRFKVYFDAKNPTYWLNKARNSLSKGSVYEVGVWFKKCLKNYLDSLK